MISSDDTISNDNNSRRTNNGNDDKDIVGHGKENEDEDEDEDFLWSDPPPRREQQTDDTTNDIHNQNNIISTPPHQYIDQTLQNNNTKKHYSSYTRQRSTENILHSNASCLHTKLILLRHGQSEANVDESLYSTKPDNAMRLTKLGWDMARMAGKALREQLPPNETVHFIVSPYARTVETFHGIASAWCDPDNDDELFRGQNAAKNEENMSRSKRLKLWYTRLMEMGLTWHEDPRIREQDCESL